MERGKFEQTEGSGDGLGPIFNVQSCRACHQNPVTGSTSQVKDLRAGHQDGFGNFVGATATLADGTITIPNRSLINQRAICPAVDTITVNGQSQTFNFPQTQGQERIRSFAVKACAYRFWKPTALLPSAVLDGRTNTPHSSRSPAMPI